MTCGEVADWLRPLEVRINVDLARLDAAIKRAGADIAASIQEGLRSGATVRGRPDAWQFAMMGGRVPTAEDAVELYREQQEKRYARGGRIDPRRTKL
jgi:hypothetical protein